MSGAFYSNSRSSQTLSPYTESPISPGSWSLNTSDVSSANESPISPPAADTNHHLNQGTLQESFSQFNGTNVSDFCDFDSPVSPHRDISMGSVNEESGIPFSSGLNLGNSYDPMPEEPTANTRSDSLGELYVEGQHASYIPGAVHDGQTINAERTFADYLQYIDMKGSPKPPTGTNEMQSQSEESMIQENKPPHNLIDLRTNNRYGLCINNPKEGIFICCLANCFAPGSSFSTWEEIHRHLNEEIEKHPFICESETCKVRFKNRADGERHVQTKNCPGQYPCSECGKPFDRKDALKQHSVTHNTPPQENEVGSPKNKNQKPKTRAKKSNRISNYPY